MDQKPPVVPRSAWRGPWGEEQHKDAPAPQQHYKLEYVGSEKRTLSAGYDLSRAGIDPSVIRTGTSAVGGTRGSSEPPLQTCRSATASPLLALAHTSSPPLRATTSLNCSLEELSARREDLEKKRKMVQNERLREQETQRREQVRLEEILNMCAEYERQVQWERDQQIRGPGVAGGQGGRAVAGTPWQQRVAMATVTPPTGRGSWENSNEDGPNSPSDSPSPGSSSGNSGSSSSPTSPPSHQAAPLTTSPVAIGSQSVHQNRIKTNGSLPRDKQRSLHSPPTDVHSQRGGNAATSPTVAPDGQKSSTPSPDTEFPFGFNFDSVPLRHVVPHSTSSLPRHFVHRRGEGEGVAEGMEVHPCRNGIPLPAASPPTSPTYPQSPRTRIRTNAASKATPSSPLPMRDRGGMVCCESEEVSGGGGAAAAGGEDGQQQHANKAALLLLSSSQGRPFGGTLPRSAIPSSRDSSRGEGMALLAANGVRNAPTDAKDSAKEPLLAESEGEAEELKRERGKLLVALAAIKRKMNDIERQQEEALRELEMEQALLEGELNAVMGKVLEEDTRAEELAQSLALYEHKAVEERECTMKQLSDCQRRVEEAQLATQRLEKDLLSNKDPDKVESLREQLKHHQETLEAERKMYEDLEFQQLEREAWWEAGREEKIREVSEVSVRARGRRQRMEHLEGAREEARGAAEGEASRIQTQRDMLLGRLNQGRQRLKVVERRLSELSRMGVNIASWDCSPEGSSDPDESPPLSSAETTTSSVGTHVLPRSQNRLPPMTLSTGNLELLNGAQGSVQRKQSQDDLDRISRVTSGAPIDVSSGGSLGRRTIESLRTIERNRQIHLVQQGSQVIEEERRRVEELKRRAQDEVRAKWEEGRLRVHASGSNMVASGTSKDVPAAGAHHLPSCNGSSAGASQSGIAGDIRVINSESLNSIGSEGEDSSVTESSDAPAESTTSSEEAAVKSRRGQRLVAAHGGKGLHSDATKMSASLAASSEQTLGTALNRMDVLPEAGGARKESLQQQQELPCSRGEVIRPISDVSSEGEEGARVRRRAASTGRLSSVQHQRPLTRYLPIRGQQLDLRAHMEWAGHQPDLCQHVQLTASACRGYLLKAPASVSASVVRRASSSSFGGGSTRGGALLSGLRGGGWTRRWFIFDRSAHCFAYYTDSSEKKSRCVVDFEGIEDVYVDHLNSVKSPSPRLTFCVKTRERAFHLVAPSAEAMRIWVDVIFTGAEGYTGFEYVT